MASDATFLSLLTHTVIVYRRSLSVASYDSYGVPIETINENSSSVECLIQPLREALEFDRRGKKELATVMGFFKITDSIIEDDIVEYKSKKYIVLGVEDAGGQSHHQEVFLRRMENQT